MPICSGAPFPYASAGLDPAIQVSLVAANDKDVDPRVTPGGGGQVRVLVRC
jgi:hypothetical protein